MISPAVLAEDAAAKRRWDEITIGKRRSIVHYINGAKKSETRLKRSLELAEKMRTYTLAGDRNPRAD